VHARHAVGVLLRLRAQRKADHECSVRTTSPTWAIFYGASRKSSRFGFTVSESVNKMTRYVGEEDPSGTRTGLSILHPRS